MISRRVVLLCLAILAVVALGGLWLQRNSRAANEPDRVEPVARLTYRGTLTHNWNGPVAGACDFEFRLFDAELNGALVGKPIQVAGISVQDGQFTVPLAADAFAIPPGSSGQTWLAVALRCPGDQGDFAALAPRLRHLGEAATNTTTGGWEIPEGASMLLCDLPTAPASPNHAAQPPTLDGVEYTLQGGFWAETGPEVKS